MRKILMILFLVIVGSVGCKAVLNGPRDRRCAQEAQAVAEEYLRAGGAAALLDSYHPGMVRSSPTDIGEFVRLEGEGYSYPVWNIQGYHFLDLRRRAHFEHGVIPIRIIVRRGIGEPEIKDSMIHVYHPDVRP